MNRWNFDVIDFCKHHAILIFRYIHPQQKHIYIGLYTDCSMYRMNCFIEFLKSYQ